MLETHTPSGGAVLTCPACGEANKDDARFCMACGVALEHRCGACDRELDHRARFCDGCGAPVADGAAAPAPVSAARKVVTVLFADLTGSTPLEERMDAESVRSVLDRFYAAMRTQVERRGGRVVKFTGDGVMAAFGVPEIREDDARRALHAALGMRSELGRLASDLDLDLALKVGVNTGEVVVSESDDDVVGDAVNVASRLEGAAEPGTVLVGEDTWRLTRSTSRFEAVEPLRLKGKAQAVAAYRLVSVDEPMADTVGTPFVGRDAELDVLRAAFAEAVESNAARLVTIIGSPGLGKTRLARELMSELAGRASVRETRCDPAGSAAFAPIAEALRAAAGISETDTEDAVVAKLAARMPEGDPDRDRVALRTAAVFGVGQAGTTEETFWALRRLIEAAARVQPVVFVLDDLHWAEPLLLDLVEHFAEWIRDAPVLLVGTGRPELRDLRPSLTEGGRAAAVIALEGLSTEATTRLALDLLGAEELPPELTAKIPVSTEGNPLFVRELVRMLVDDGVLLRTQDGWTVTVDVDAIQVPPTITSLLSARVDRLRTDERTVVELASVVGKEFYRGALYDLAPTMVRNVVDGCLESLRRKELVEPAGTYWIDEPVYRFHHVLIRDAAYRRLLKESRADLHERVASWLERKTEGLLGEHDEVVGYHLEQAHEYRRQLGRPDAELGRRAAASLGAAARRALDRDDLAAAAALSGRALDRLGPEDAGRPELLLVRCEALLSMGDVAQGASAVGELVGLAATPALAAWATSFSGHLANLTAPERLHETESAVAAAAVELARLGEQAGTAKARTVHASTLAGLGRFGECEAVLDAALTAARAANDRRRITATLGAAPHAALWGPNPVSRAGGRCLDVVRLLRITTGSPAVEQASLRCQAVLEAFRGRADAARHMLSKVRRSLLELGLRHELLETELFAGIVELVAADAAAAIEHLRTAHAGFRELGVDVLAAQSAALLARAHLMLGDEEEAASFAWTSEQLGSQDLKTAIAWRSVKAEILARRGELEEARRLAEAAVAVAEGTDALYDHGMACRSLATVLRPPGAAGAPGRADDRALALCERTAATALCGRGPVEPDRAAAREPAQAWYPAPNRCAREVMRLCDHLNRGDVEGALSLQAEDSVREDRRSGLRSVMDRESQRRDFREIARDGNRSTVTVVATRGERLALLTWHWDISRFAYEVDVLLLGELDDEGRFRHIVTFDAQGADDAFAELDERYAAGEDALYADLLRTDAALMQALNNRDWERLRRLFLPGGPVVDRTPASRGEMTVDQWISSIEALVGLASGLCVRAIAVHAVGADAVLSEAHNRGVSVDSGGEIDVAYQFLTVHHAGRICRLELFPAEHLEAALARFRELTAGESKLDNLAARAQRAMYECVIRRDFDQVRSHFADGCTWEDRRSGLGAMVVGVEERVELLRVVASIGMKRVERTVLATRGEALVLARTTFGGRDDSIFVVELLHLSQIDENGRVKTCVLFDPDDLDAALVELDRRYVAGEGAPYADLWQVVRSMVDALNAGDTVALLACVSPSAVVVDHRPASLGRPRAEERVGFVESMVDLAPDMYRWASKVEAIAEGRALFLLAGRGTTTDGMDVELVYYTLNCVRDGVITLLELFGEDDLDAALARFEELGATTSTPGPPDNRCARRVREFGERFNAGDLEGALALFGPQALEEDRRTGLQHTYVSGDWRETLEFLSRVGARLDGTLVATRGESLALTSDLWHGKPDHAWEAEVLSVVEIDDDGLIGRFVKFDLEAIEDAYAELEARFVASVSTELGAVWRSVCAFITAHNARDSAGLLETLSDDFVVVDHRPASLGRSQGREASLRHMLPDVRARAVRIHDLGAHGAAFEAVARGTSREGGEVELAFHAVTRVRDGQIARVELFPVDRLDEAMACLHGFSVARLENACTRADARHAHAINARDWDAIASFLAEQVVLDDRRPMLRNRIVGRDAVLENIRAAFGVSAFKMTTEAIATRGDRCALFRQVFGSRLDTEWLAVAEVNEDQQWARVVFFEPEDLEAALDELDEGFAATLPEASGRVARVVARFARALNNNDSDQLREVIAHDYALVDHRPASVGRLRGADAFLTYIQPLQDQLSEMSAYAAEILGLRAPWVLVLLSITGTSVDGVEVDVSVYQLGEVRDGRYVRMEAFHLDQREAAIARFEELGRED